jgi:hypothetical protein
MQGQAMRFLGGLWTNANDADHQRPHAELKLAAFAFRRIGSVVIVALSPPPGSRSKGLWWLSRGRSLWPCV